MEQNLRKLLLLTYCSVSIVFSAFSQRVLTEEDYEAYDWSNFDGEDFFYSAIICAVIIIVGLLIKKKSNNDYLKGLGTTIVVIGSIISFGLLGSPILAAIQIIWQVFIGCAIFFGIIYWVYTRYID